MAKRGESLKKKESLDEERNALASERTTLAEERTLLAYIRTELAIIGVAILILKFYFDEMFWSLSLVIILIVVGIIMVTREVLKIGKLRKNRQMLQRK